VSTTDARVRQATAADREALWAFLSSAYGALSEYKLPERWKWLFEDNPYIDERGLPIWIAEHEGRIVGQMCAMPIELRIDGEPHPAAWAIDLVVLPECRGQGLGNRLHEAAVEHSGILMKLTMAASTRRMAERAGCLNLAPLPMYFRPARMTARAVREYLLKRTERRPWLRRIAHIGTRYAHLDLPIAAVINLRSRLRGLGRRPAPSRTEVLEKQEFDADFDEIERLTSGGFGVTVARSPRFLRWRFRSLGGLRYRAFVARRDGQPLGYVVLRHPDPIERQAGVIVDLVCAPEDQQTAEDLLRFAVDFFGAGVAGIVCSLPEREFGSSLRRSGFLRAGQQNPTCVCTDPETRAKLAEQHGNWYLSRADHDWDQVLP
jgi:GNAT superfamily N-acetyltransferase